jgi:hypothetical protein
MKINEAVIAGAAGTTAFTLFSYLASLSTMENFREPELLGKILNRTIPGLPESESKLAGWLSHYLVGIGFAMIYLHFIKTKKIPPSMIHGAIAGALSGVPASVIWNFVLKKHPFPPRKRTYSFYLQLLIGHAIFGSVCFGIFKSQSRLNHNNYCEISRQP